MGLELYNLPFYNNSGETVPPFAVMQVDSWTEANNRDYFRIRKPNGSGKQFIINGPFSIAAGSDGMGSRSPGIHASYNIAATPSVDQEWGPVSGSWLLNRTGTGYYITGDLTFIGGISVVRVSESKGATPTVYEFQSCDNNDRRLRLDNPAIGEHEPGEVAVIKTDGLIECWELLGEAEDCATGQCAKILGWGANCAACQGCFVLTPCGGGSPEVVEGVEWFEYNGRVVTIDVAGTETCFEVASYDPPGDGGCTTTEAWTVDDVIDDFDNCAKCGGCYEMTPCGGGTPRYIRNDLAGHLGLESGADVVGEVFSFEKLCWEVTAFDETCEESEIETIPWYDQGFQSHPGGLRHVDSCNACCFILTPCPGQDGDPEPLEVVQTAIDTVDLYEFVDPETGQSNGKVIRLGDNVCYTVAQSDACEDPQEGLGTVLETYEKPSDEDNACNGCRLTEWQKCGTTDRIITYSDLEGFNEAAVGSPYTTTRILKRAEDTFCYEFYGNPTSGTTVAFTVEEDYATCAICADPKIKLTPSCEECDCDGGEGGGASGGANIIIETENAPEGLEEALGKYVKIEGRCYLVSYTADAATTALIDCYFGPFDTCASCAIAPGLVTFGGEIEYDDATESFKQRMFTMMVAGSVCGEEWVTVLETTEECPEE